jgi:uncharacterized protein YlxW (UPF0749 family)
MLTAMLIPATAWPAIGSVLIALVGIITTMLVERGKTQRTLIAEIRAVHAVAQEAREMARPVSNGAVPAIVDSLDAIQRVNSRLETRFDQLTERVDSVSARVSSTTERLESAIEDLRFRLSKVRCNLDT